MSRLGVVVVGRNEGQRLHTSIRSVLGCGAPVVYVDSASHDGSATWARTVGVDVVELDSSKPMSAARARNAGFDHLLATHPDIEFVQFVDGDCEVCTGWLECGVAALCSDPGIGIVCGQVIERHPQATIYNLMCSVEWRKAPGEILACGGIFLARADVYRQVGGFRIDVMAAEDDELCLRLRRFGHKIVAVAEPMVLHDAAITRFSQWWTRARRTGMAYAQGAALHGASPERHFTRNCRSVLFWALVVPTTTLTLALPTRGLSLLGFLGYPALAVRIYRGALKRGCTKQEARLLAVFHVIAKWPELLGIIYFHRRAYSQQHVELIEYKGLKHQ